jgi:GTP-binding protein HflX
MERSGRTSLFISAHNREGIEALRAALYERVKEIHVKRYPYNSFLY